MPSTSIEVNNGYPIDRTMPAIFRGYINSNDWIDFCDNYDAKAVPSVPDNDDAIIAGGMFLCIVAGILIIFDSANQESRRNSWERPSTSVGMPVGMLLLFVTFVVGMGCLKKHSRDKSDQFFREISRICADASNRQPCLTFHLKRVTLSGPIRGGHHTLIEYLYIHVSLVEATTLVTTEATQYIYPEIAYASASVLPNSVLIQTTAERMQELERIKHLLTGEEYVQKRNDIIASV